MQKIYTSIVILLLILPQLFANGYTTQLDYLIKNKPDSVIRMQKDSVLAPPIGFQYREVANKETGKGFNTLAAISAPSLSSPINNAVVYGTTVSLYWNKNNNANACNYFVKVVDLTTLTILYDYAPVGDLSSFEARSLVVGHTYSWLVRAVSQTNSSETTETPFINFAVSNTNPPTLSLTSINGTTFCGNNRQLTINYSRTGNFNSGSINYNNNYYYGNIFIELSNKNGDFINPTFVGGVTQSANTGSFSVTLPNNLPYGQNYKIRLFSYNSIVTSNISSAITIGTIDSPTILNKYNESVSNTYFTMCSGNTATVKTNITDSTNVTFQWRKDGVNISSGGNYAKYTISTGGNYSIAITQGGCPTVISSGVQVSTTTGENSYSLQRNGSAIQCIGGQASLTLPDWTDNQTYQWFRNGLLISGENQRTYVATQSGTYSVKSSSTNTCSTQGESDLLTFGSAISFTTSFDESTICSTGGQTNAYVNNVTYSPNLATTYQWKRNNVNISGATFNNLTITQAGVYNVEVTQASCKTISQGFEIKTSTTLDSVKITQSYSSYCNPSSIYLYPNTGLQNITYNWKKSGSTVSTNSGYEVTQDGSYTLTLTQGSCSTTSKPLTVSLNSNREISLYLAGNYDYKKDTVYICSDSPQAIYPRNYQSGTYQWYKDNIAIGGATSNYFYASQRGSYTFQVTSGSCVIMSKPIFVETTLPKFSLNSTPQNNLCANNIVKLDYYNQGLYPYLCSVWKKDGIAFNTCASQVSILESGIYTATVQQGSCVVESEPLKITIGEPITATISGNSTISAGSSANVYVNFTGASPWIFTLSDGTVVTTSKNPHVVTVSPTATKTYTISSVIGSCGTGTTSGSATVTIGTCNTPTIITNQPLTQTKCMGSTVTFSVVATGGGTLTYQWKKDGQNINGANTSTLTIRSLKFSDLGNYSVSVTGTCGMVLSNSAVLKVTNDVPFYIVQPSIVTTTGSNVFLQTNTYNLPISSFSWQGPNGYSSSVENPIISNIGLSNSGTYTAFASNTQGCVGQAVASITVVAPSITINSLSATSFCSGQTGSISFTTPSGVATTYAVQLSNSDGFFNTNPTVLGRGSSSPINFTLPSSSSGTTYNYKLRIVDTQNPTQVSAPSAVIYFNSLTALIQDAVGSSFLSICSGSSIKLYAKLNVPTTNNVIYEWQKDGNTIAGATAATYITNQLGAYTVKATVTGCGNATSTSTNVYLTKDSGGFANSISAFQCAGSSIELKARYNSENTTYVWKKDGVTLSNNTNSLTVSQSGTYSLTSSDTNCNYNYIESRQYTFSNIIPTLLNNSDSAFACTNYSVYLSTYFPNNNLYSYQWQKNGEPILNATNDYYSPSSSGIYSLKVTQGNCTAMSKPVVVTTGVTPSSLIKIYGSPNICTGSTASYLYVSGLACGNYQWQKDQVDIPSQTNYRYIPSQSGSYRVKITNGTSITYSNSIDIVASNTPTYTISTDADTITCTPNYYYYLNTYNLLGATFQWYKNNSPISGAVSSGYNTYADGVYKLKVTVGTCVGYSQDVNVITRNYLTKPILESKQGTIVCNNTYTTLSPKSSLSNIDFYQWKKDGVNIPNTNNVSLYSFPITESGTYTLQITQEACSVESDPIKINVGDKQQSIKTANWDNPATWSCGTVPTITENILINKSHVVSLPNNTTGFVKNLELQGSIIQGSNARLKFLTN